MFHEKWLKYPVFCEIFAKQNKANFFAFFAIQQNAKKYKSLASIFDPEKCKTFAKWLTLFAGMETLNYTCSFKWSYISNLSDQEWQGYYSLEQLSKYCQNLPEPRLLIHILDHIPTNNKDKNVCPEKSAKHDLQRKRQVTEQLLTLYCH